MALAISPSASPDARCRLLAGAVPIGAGRLLSRTLLTAADGAEILNAMPVRDSPQDSYDLVNVINRDNSVFLSDGRYRPVPGREDHPLTGISWHGAQALAARVGARLPTPDEWREVATAHGTRYPWGDRPPDPTRANYDEHVGGTTPVRRYPPSLLGLHDLLGNAGEWCLPGGGPADEAPVCGGGWNKPIGPDWWQPRYKWRRIGTVAIGVRLLFETEAAR